jgi:lysozyme
MNLVQRIKQHEGFSEKPYPDPISKGEPWTFGYGFTYLTKEEASVLLEMRVKEIQTKLLNDKQWAFLYKLPTEITEVIVEMIFQLGFAGVNKFVNFKGALMNEDYDRAIIEMKDSLWYKQTPSRVESLAEILESLK